MVLKGFPNIFLQDRFVFSQLQGRKEERKKATTQFYLENQLSAIITVPIIVQISLYFYTLELDQLNAHGTPVSSHINRSSKAV